MLKEKHMYTNIWLKIIEFLSQILESASQKPIINPFIPSAPFLYHWNYQKTVFLMFSGGRERVHWEWMG